MSRKNRRRVKQYRGAADAVCPWCGAKCDCHTNSGLGGAGAPEPGAFSICFYCGEVSVMGPTLALRKLTAAESFEWSMSPALAEARRARVMLVARAKFGAFPVAAFRGRVGADGVVDATPCDVGDLDDLFKPGKFPGV